MRHPPILPLLLAFSAVAACTDAGSPPTTALASPGGAAASLSDAPVRTSAIDHVLFFVKGGPPAFAAVTR